ncbi:MAG: HAMP domain-containing histidine kinase [Neomegalonema sp.]|nr:HAMP domain-containing histidine kinase [Neomegalonema sp.]
MAKSDLEQADAGDPAAAQVSWVWDPLSLRIVAASGAALRYWRVEKLSDLKERDFAADMPMVAALSRIDAMLAEGEKRLDLLPLYEQAPQPVSVRKVIGIKGRLCLQVSVLTALDETATALLRLQMAFDGTVVPSLLLTGGGEALLANSAARLAFGTIAGLSELLTEPVGCDAALAEALSHGSFSLRSAFATRSGQQCYRMSLRRLWDPALQGATILAQFLPIAIAGESGGDADLTAADPGADLLSILPQGAAVFAEDDLRLLFANAPAQRAFEQANPTGVDSLLDLAPSQARQIEKALIALRRNPGVPVSLEIAPEAAREGLRAQIASHFWQGERARLLLLSAAEPPAEESAVETPVLVQAQDTQTLETQALKTLALETLGALVLRLSENGIIAQIDQAPGDLEVEALIGEKLTDWLDPSSAERFKIALNRLSRGLSPASFDALLSLGQAQFAGQGHLFAVAPHMGAHYGLLLVPGMRAVESAGDALRALPSAAMQEARLDEVALVSHELRTPLNTVLGYAHLVRRNLPDRADLTEARAHVETILETAHYMERVLSMLLEQKKSRISVALADRQPVDLEQIVALVCHGLAPEIARRSLHLSVDAQPDLPDPVAEPQALRQALTDIMANAVKYTDPNGTIALTLAQEDDGAISVEIADHGPGMTREELEIALAPFGRPTSRRDARRRIATGIGLGLPFARSLIEAMGARFEIDSVRGLGTTVRILFDAPQELDAPLLIARD